MILRFENQVKAMRFVVYVLAIFSPFALVTSKNLPKIGQHNQQNPGKSSSSSDKVIVCTTTLTAPTTEPTFELENSDLTLCTHLICIDNIWDKSITFWSTSDQQKERKYDKIVKLRQKYPRLKISLAIKYFLSAYSGIAENDEHRQTFAKKATDFIVRHKFDGLDLVWDFSDRNGIQGIPEENKILSLIKELKTDFKPHNLLLTASFIAANTHFTTVLDVAAISKHLHYVHLIPKYNYIETWPGSYRIEDVLRERSRSRLEKSVDNLIKLGVTPAKIVIGLPFIGLAFHSFFDLSMKHATFRQTLEYREICERLMTNELVQWDSYYDDDSGLAIAKRDSARYGMLRPTDVIVYENGRSIANKILFILSRNLGGAMAFPIDMDDFDGSCGGIDADTFADFIRGQNLQLPKSQNITQPLLKTINIAMRIATPEETQARVSNKFEQFQAADRMSAIEVRNDDLTARIPHKYKPFAPLIYMINDAIVVAIDKFIGYARTRRNDQQIIEPPSITSFIASIPNLPTMFFSLVFGLISKMTGY